MGPNRCDQCRLCSSPATQSTWTETQAPYPGFAGPRNPRWISLDFLASLPSSSVAPHADRLYLLFTYTVPHPGTPALTSLPLQVLPALQGSGSIQLPLGDFFVHASKNHPISPLGVPHAPLNNGRSSLLFSLVSLLSQHLRCLSTPNNLFRARCWIFYLFFNTLPP